MSQVHIWKDGKLHETSDSITEYLLSLRGCMEYLRAGYVEQGYVPTSVQDLVNTVVGADLDFVIGGTWIAAFSVESVWFMEDKICMEEFYGPRWLGDTLDLQDFMEGASEFARQQGASRLEFGTRANPRHKGLSRKCEQLGATISAVTLTKVL